MQKKVTALNLQLTFGKFCITVTKRVPNHSNFIKILKKNYFLPQLLNLKSQSEIISTVFSCFHQNFGLYSSESFYASISAYIGPWGGVVVKALR